MEGVTYSDFARFFLFVYCRYMSRIAQTVKRLATGWKIGFRSPTGTDRYFSLRHHVETGSED